MRELACSHHTPSGTRVTTCHQFQYVLTSAKPHGPFYEEATFLNLSHINLSTVAWTAARRGERISWDRSVLRSVQPQVMRLHIWIRCLPFSLVFQSQLRLHTYACLLYNLAGGSGPKTHQRETPPPPHPPLYTPPPLRENSTTIKFQIKLPAPY